MMTSIGDTLRNERIRRGIKLEQVAEETKICLHHLKALEANRFDRVPGGIFFTRSFLRQYAQALALDEQELIASLNEQFVEPADPFPEPQPKHYSLHIPHLSLHIPHLSLHIPHLAEFAAVAALFACAGAYSLWESSRTTPPNTETTTLSPRHAQLQRSARLKPALPRMTRSEPAESEAHRALVPAGGTTGGLQASGQTLASVAGPQDSPTAVRVAFTATEPVWVSIKCDGTHTYSGMLGAQQSKQIEASTNVRVLIGNAGGLEIFLNGRPVGPIGARGEVQVLEFTSEGVRVVPRARNSAPIADDAKDPADESERPHAM